MSCSNEGRNSALDFQTVTQHESDWPWPDWFRDLAPAIARMWQKRRERQRLLTLDPRLLKDIGITRDQADKEAAKWIWE
jgi:uncharacterized protein YjiS (DUF1127 family)